MNNLSTIFATVTAISALATGCIVSDGDDDAANTGGTATTASGGDGGDGGAAAGGGDAGGSDAGGGGTAPVETGWVFTMSNEAANNDLIIYQRADDGALTQLPSVPTGGDGSGDGLGSQAALTLSPSGEYLYVVNAGSNQISSFRIFDDHLALVDLVDSGGERPVSVTATDDLVYVVNAGGDGVVQGFASDGGMMTPLGQQSLSGPGAGPAQIGINPEGNALIVTEKATNSLLTYWVAPDGSMSAATVTASEGMTPFGFDFTTDGRLLVSEAFGGMDGMSAVSSYNLGSIEPEVISSSVPSGQTAACWLVIAQDTFAYTTNTASNNLSGYSIDGDGVVNLFDDSGVTADVGDEQSPIDAALSAGHQFMYVLNARSDELVGFNINADGTLGQMSETHDVPMPAVGLVAR